MARRKYPRGTWSSLLGTAHYGPRPPAPAQRCSMCGTFYSPGAFQAHMKHDPHHRQVAEARAAASRAAARRRR